MSINVAIVGAGGYAGAELAEILLRHPRARIVGLYASARREKEASAGGGAFDEVFPRFRGRLTLPVKAASADTIAEAGPHAVFLATPHEASVELAPELLARGMKVFDLSAGFRLKEASLYPIHYGFEHSKPDELARAVYGLPELFRDRVAAADLVAVPGCYPTSAILPLRPLVRAGAVAPGSRVIIDSVSGVSGAGRGAVLKSLFCEVSLQAYGVMSHRHEPEIAAFAQHPVVFTPHLVALERGILSTIHVELAAGWDGERVGALFHDVYASEAFVRLLSPGRWPAVADVRGTNYCDFAWQASTSGHLIISSAIDNLVKGAAGQAVQCMNIRFGIPEGTGLHYPQSVAETAGTP